MAKLACFLACVLVVAVSADRSSSRDSSSSSGSRDNSIGVRDFGFDTGRGSSGNSGSRASSVNSNRGPSSSRWNDEDDAENDFSNPQIKAWKNGVVPYEISSDISAANTAALKRMFEDISEKTCVRFAPKRSSDSSHVFVKSGNKCSAPLGQSTSSSSSAGRQSSFSVSGSVSNVILGQSCFTTKRVGRRIMNLLGIPHEANRPDRDQFVEINFSNLRTGYADNVKQVASSAYLPGVLDVPYDYQSITQYNDDDLAKDSNTWAIRAKGRRNTQLGGDSFSSGDFEKIRRAYNCSSSHSSSRTSSTRSWSRG